MKKKVVKKLEKKRGIIFIAIVILISILSYSFLNNSGEKNSEISDEQVVIPDSNSENSNTKNTVERETEFCSSPNKLIEGYWANPSVIKMPDGKLRMYYDCSGNDEECEFLDRGIHSAVSYDDKKWTKESGRRITFGKTPFIFEKGDYKLYFAESDESSIGVVASYDAIAFEGNSESSVPRGRIVGLVVVNDLIAKGDELDIEGISDPSIIAINEGYRMYYLGDSGKKNILSAFSASGVEWTKEEGERIDSSLFKDIKGPEIVKEGGKYILYFSGEGGIYQAFSDDGLEFETPRLILEAEERKIPCSPSVRKEGDKWVIYYSIPGEGIYNVECEEK